MEEALYLTGFARSVTLIYPSERLTAPKILQEQAAQNPKLRFLPHSVVEEVGGEGHDVLDRMVIRNVQTGQLTELRADSRDGMFGLFGFLGFQPSTRLFEGQLDTEGGYLLTDADMHTNLPGVFAAGDIRKKESAAGSHRRCGRRYCRRSGGTVSPAAEIRNPAGTEFPPGFP